MKKPNVNVNDNVNENVNVNVNGNDNVEEEKVIEEYQREIGLMTPFQLSKLEDYMQKLPSEMVIEAIHRASNNNKKSLSYIEAILKQWIASGYKTLADIKDTKKKRPDETNEERVKRLFGG